MSLSCVGPVTRGFFKINATNVWVHLYMDFKNKYYITKQPFVGWVHRFGTIDAKCRL